MTRTPFRTLTIVLGLLALSLAAGRAAGQGGELKPYRMKPDQAGGSDESKLVDLQNARLKTTGPDLKANKELFRKVAQSYVYQVTYDEFYLPDDKGELKPRPDNLRVDTVLRDLGNRLHFPAADSKLTADQADYIKHFGEALDAAVREVLLKVPPPPNRAAGAADPAAIIRVNAGRMLALVARTGAPAHAKTITALLTNQFYTDKDKKPVETPLELVYYTLKAAEGLLAAYDPLKMLGATPASHTAADEDLVPMVAALTKLIEAGPPVAGKAAKLNPDEAARGPALSADPAEPKRDAPAAPAAAKPEAQQLTPEEVALSQFVRRQAVRALARCRFDTLGGDGQVPLVRPAYTLAKVVLADTSITPLLTTQEQAEAVIGLAGISPTQALNVDVLAVLVARGIDTVARRKPDEGKLVPWKGYAARLAAALAALKKGAQTNARLRPFAAQLGQLADIATADVLGPLEKDDGSGAAIVNFDRLAGWIEANAPKDASRGLFSEGPPAPFNPRAGGR